MIQAIVHRINDVPTIGEEPLSLSRQMAGGILPKACKMPGVFAKRLKEKKRERENLRPGMIIIYFFLHINP